MPIPRIMCPIPDNLQNHVLLARRGFIIQAVVSRKPLMPILWMLFLLAVVFLIVLYHFSSNLRSFRSSLYHCLLGVCQKAFFGPRNLLHRVLLARRGFIIQAVVSRKPLMPIPRI